MRDATTASGARAFSANGDQRAVKIMAKSVYRELKANGHSRGDIVSFTNALLELVTTDLQSSSD